MPDLLKKIAFTLAKGGVASLRFDKRGLGGKLPSRADELAEFARWENFVDDSMAAYRFLASQPEIDRARVAVLGHSEGAMLALEVSARLQQHNQPPAAIVLVAAPGRRMDVVLRSQLAALGERQGGGAAAKAALAEVDRAIASIRASGQVPSDLAPNVAPIFPAYLGPFMRSWFAVDTPGLAKAYAGPVLLIFGEQDAQLMPHEDARLIEAGLAQRPKDEHETLYVAGASHNLKLLSGSNGIDGILAPAASLKLRSWLAAKLANPGQR